MLTSDKIITLQRLGYLECMDHPAMWVEEQRTYGIEDITYFDNLLHAPQYKRRLNCSLCGAIYNESVNRWEYSSVYHQFSEQYLEKRILDFLKHKLRCIMALELISLEVINA